MKTYRTLFHTTALAAAIAASVPALADVETTRKANGANAAAIQGTVDDFRNDLGAFNAPNPVNAADGRRQINWDAAPDAISAPNAFPGDFFNANVFPRARGIEFVTDGTGFQLSATAASGAGIEFDNLQAGLSTEFDVFSAERLFTPIGSNQTRVFFFDPANPDTPALVDGLGVVFTGVDDAGSTKIDFFNANGDLIASEEAVPQPGDGGLSFVGVKFDQNELASATITSGSATLQVGIIGPGDTVVMDDFIFGEPDVGVLGLPNFAGVAGLAPNQQAVGNALDALFASAATDPALKVVIAAVAGGTAAGIGNRLNQFSPEFYDAPVQASLASTERFHDAINKRFSAAGTYCPDCTQEYGPFTVWSRGSGTVSDQEGGAGHTDYDSTAFDIQFGADYAVTPSTRVGAAVAYSTTDIDGNTGDADFDQFEGGIYAHTGLNGFALDASASYAKVSGDATRRVDFTAGPGAFIRRTAKGDVDYDQITGRVVGSYTANLGGAKIRPFAGFEAAHVSGDDFTETGAGNLNLDVDTDDETRVSGMAGVEIAGQFAANGVILMPSAGVGVKHHFSGSDRSITASIAGAPGTAFTVDNDVPETVLDISLGLGAVFDGGVKAHLGYSGEFGDGFDSHGANLLVTIPL